MTDFTQKLPVELLVMILGHTPVSDILRLKQINHALRDVILSPHLIRHKLDLHAAGLEYNPIVGVDLAESQRIFNKYLSNLDSSPVVETRTINSLRTPRCSKVSKTAGGVLAIVDESVLLFTLGSPLRGIHREWEIPFPCASINNYSFYPDADIIAFVEWQTYDGAQVTIHLRSLSNGGCHPAAQCPTVQYRCPASVYIIPSVSISNFRLAVLMSTENGEHLVVWDWRSAKILYALENDRYTSPEFVDDYRLLVILTPLKDDAPCVLLMDTEKDVGGAPMQTSFRLSPYFSFARRPSLLLERGVHKPSPTEYLSPFYQDPAQRIAVLDMRPGTWYSFPYLIFRVEVLLKLAGDREGCEIEWDGWKKHAFFTTTPNGFADVWVSGCRFFRFKNAPTPTIDIYDFSTRGRVGRLSKQIDSDLGAVECLRPTRAKLPTTRRLDDFIVVGGGRESIVFYKAMREDEATLHIWTF